MIRLIKKYVIIGVIAFLSVRFLAVIILIKWPNLMSTQQPDGSIRTLDSEYLIRVIEYLFNLIIIYLLYVDMKREKVKNVPILILTFFFNLLGIIFFFLSIINNKFNNNESIY